MKGLLIILCSVIALASAATVDTFRCHKDPNEAPAICKAPGSEGVLVAHEKCNKFYKCSHGKPVAFKCPSKLLYNTEIGVCDWPNNVDCKNRTVPDHDVESPEEDVEEKEINNDPSKVPEICEKHESVLVAHENCNYFYQCANGKPVARQCPRGLVYNYYIEQCDWPKNVNCGKRIILEDDKDDEKEPEDNATENEIAGHDDPSKAPIICAEQGSDSILVAHELCNKFYICASGIPITLDCPNGLLYKPKWERCDWPDAVTCGGRIPPSDNNEGCNQDKEDDGDKDINHSEAQKICAQGGSSGRQLPHKYCDKFYVCIFNRAVSMTCPFKFLFNSNTSKCDWPSNVDCKGRVDPRGKTCKKTLSNDQDLVYGHSSTAKIICSDEKSDGTLISHKYCNKFYQCVDFYPVELSCPSNLHFSPEAQYCDWPEDVDCGDRIIPEDTEDDTDKDNSDEDDSKPAGNNFDDPSQAPEICAKENSDGTHIAHEYCNKFYICVNRRPVALECPENLWYNPKIERCDWQRNVECNGRVLP